MKAAQRKKQREKEMSINSSSKNESSNSKIDKNSNIIFQNTKINNESQNNLILHLPTNSINSSAPSISNTNSNNTNTNKNLNKVYTRKILKNSLMTVNSAAKPAEEDYEIINSNNNQIPKSNRSKVQYSDNIMSQNGIKTNLHHKNSSKDYFKNKNNRKSSKNISLKDKKNNSLKNIIPKKTNKKNQNINFDNDYNSDNVNNNNNDNDNNHLNDINSISSFLDKKNNLSPKEKKKNLSKMFKLLNTEVSIDNYEIGKNVSYIESKKELDKLQEQFIEEENKLQILLSKNNTEAQKYVETIIKLQNQLLNSPQWDVITLEEENKIDDVKIKKLKEKIELMKEESDKEIEEIQNIKFDEINDTLRKEIEKVQNLKKTILKFKGREIPEEITKEIEVVMKYKNGI